jgi:hypothetical protein
MLVSHSAASAEPSILQPLPPEVVLNLYSKPFGELTDSQKWRIKIHGLRLTPLHPAIWGTLRREQTDNRHLVPIKRYILRDSEQSGYELEEISVSFRFKQESARYMERMPHQKDPVFEIGFGGEFAEDSIADAPKRDRFYALRFSAFPRLESSLFLRDQENFTMLVPMAQKQLAVGVDYKVSIKCRESKLSADLNGQPAVTWQSPAEHNPCRGLVYLQTSWHPVFVKELTVRGSQVDGAARQSVSHSGILPNPKTTK